MLHNLLKYWSYHHTWKVWKEICSDKLITFPRKHRWSSSTENSFVGIDLPKTKALKIINSYFNATGQKTETNKQTRKQKKIKNFHTFNLSLTSFNLVLSFWLWSQYSSSALSPKHLLIMGLRVKLWARSLYLLIISKD